MGAKAATGHQVEQINWFTSLYILSVFFEKSQIELASFLNFPPIATPLDYLKHGNMPSLGQLENATLKEMESTARVHRGTLDILPGAPRVSEVRLAMAPA
jgi:hypothetical protein